MLLFASRLFLGKECEEDPSYREALRRNLARICVAICRGFAAQEHCDADVFTQGVFRKTTLSDSKVTQKWPWPSVLKLTLSTR